jgi:hypothetical protein
MTISVSSTVPRRTGVSVGTAMLQAQKAGLKGEFRAFTVSTYTYDSPIRNLGALVDLSVRRMEDESEYGSGDGPYYCALCHVCVTFVAFVRALGT